MLNSYTVLNSLAMNILLVQMQRYRILVLFLVILLAICCDSERRPRHFDRIPLGPGAIGPETIAFDCHGRGPFVGVSDGRILRWTGFPHLGWTKFAVMPNWSRSCIGLNNSPNQSHCGRPLGLKFHPKTCKLYVADAYHGLVVVGRKGGRGISVLKGAEGVPFKFTNSLDIDHESGVVYFTDTSSRFALWEAQRAIETLDSTGRLMIYNLSTRKVKVLLNNLSFANGVALSRNKDFLLVAETSTHQIRKFWLKGPRYNTDDVFLSLQGRPDNINRDSHDNFWIAVLPVQTPLPSNHSNASIKIDEQGRILERLDAESGELVSNASDVSEFNGRLWVGSVFNTYIQVALIT